MCIFKSGREVIVCDVAIGAVKAQLEADLGSAVRYTVIHGQGTLVEAASGINRHRFEQLVRTGITSSLPRSDAETAHSWPEMRKNDRGEPGVRAGDGAGIPVLVGLILLMLVGAGRLLASALRGRM